MTVEEVLTTAPCELNEVTGGHAFDSLVTLSPIWQSRGYATKFLYVNFILISGDKAFILVVSDSWKSYNYFQISIFILNKMI